MLIAPFLLGLSPVQVTVTHGSEGSGTQWSHSEQKVDFPHGMLFHPSIAPEKRAGICPSQAKPHFLLFFCLFQGDPGIQGYPGRKVRRGAPILLNELRCTDALQDQVCKSVDFSGALC